jgi:hypothetical protein
MLKYRRIIRESAKVVADAASRTADDYAVGEIEHEPDFTGEMLGRMKEAINGYRIRGVRWTAKMLTSAGANAQEHAFGADFLGVVQFEFPDYRITKGFLAQAKRIDSDGHMTPQNWDRLVEQCRQMLSITNESYVFVYSRSGIIIVPALAITSATSRHNPHEFYSKTARRFYIEHFECFIGDSAISSADVKTLERLRAGHALYLGAAPIQQMLDMKEQ